MSAPPLPLAGKRAIVTGAASGIGRAAAVGFARAGAAVVLADRDARVAESCAAVTAAGGRAHAVVGDVADELVIAELIAAARTHFGGLDVVFANAGISGDVLGFEELDAAAWLAVLRVNLVGTALLVKHAARALREAGTGGAIVCTASVAGLRAGAGPSPYSASKAGVINLVQTAAMQLAGTGIRVNALAPGLVETGMTEPVFSAARAAGKAHKLGQLNPLRRTASPDELAAAALFLASDASSYVNGTVLVVDGGLSATLPFVPDRLW